MIIGQGGDDKINIGSNGINLNGDNDVDVTFSGVEILTINGGAGADFISGQSNSVVGNEFADDLILLGVPVMMI